LRYSVIKSGWPSLAFLLIILFAIPFSHENILGGFQSQFYALLLLSLIAMVLLIEAPTFSGAWWAGLALAALSFLTMASGALTPFAAAGFMIFQILAGARRSSPREYAAIPILIGTGFALLAFTVAIPAHAWLRAENPLDFIFALSQALGWPVPLSILSPFLLNAPLILLAVYLFRQRRPTTDPAWRILGLAAWVGLQGVSLAYGRAVSELAPRYLDTMALLTVLNFVALLALKGFIPERWRLRFANRMAPAWFAVIGACLVWHAAQLPRYFLKEVPRSAARTENFTTFVRTGNAAALDQPYLHIPYPDPARLAAIASAPEILGTLHPSFGAPVRHREAVRQRLLLHGGVNLGPGGAAKIARLIGAISTAAGLAVLLFLLFPRVARPSRTASDP
jgi:hypothetical protein